MMKRCALLVLMGCVFGCEGAPGVDGGSGGGGPAGGGGGAADTTRPTLIETTPPHSAASVSVSTSLLVRFDEPMNAASVRVATTPSTALGSPSWNAAGTEVQFTLPAALSFGTLYSVTVTGADRSGKELASVEFSFTTETQADTAAPTVVATLPAAGATQDRGSNE